MDHAVDARKAFVQFTMDVPLYEALWCVWVKRTGVRHEIFDDISAVCDVCWRNVARHEEIRYVVGIADLVCQGWLDTWAMAEFVWRIDIVHSCGRRRRGHHCSGGCGGL